MHAKNCGIPWAGMRPIFPILGLKWTNTRAALVDCSSMPDGYGGRGLVGNSLDGVERISASVITAALPTGATYPNSA